MENVYGFTTVPSDEYFDRVLAEATPETNFVISTERNTVTGDGSDTIVLHVRKRIFILALAIPDDTLVGTPLADLLDAAAEDFIQSDRDASEEGNDWAQAIIVTNDVERSLESLRHEIRRIDNVLNGRVVRVTVESY